MKHSVLLSASQSLAEFLLGAGASARIDLQSSPDLSVVNPALIFRVALTAPEKTAEQLQQQFTAVGTGALVVERSIARAMNAHRPWVDLNLGMAHIVAGSVSIAGDPAVLLFDYRFSPTSYESDA